MIGLEVSLQQALRATDVLLGLTLMFQAWENLILQRRLQVFNIWTAMPLQKELNLSRAPFGALINWVYQEHGYALLMTSQRFCALLLIFGIGLKPITVVLVAVRLLQAVRWRGTFNGGSDFMTMVVCCGLAISHASSDELMIKVGLTYIAVQCVLSYFIAGLAKLRTKKWRSGIALHEFLFSSAYQTPASLKKLKISPSVWRMLSYLSIGWELAFPLPLTHPALAWPFVASGVIFHLLLTWLFGLNRFFWAWLASYPALLWLVGA